MKRTIMTELKAWKDSKRRKPLLLQGARQVGKSWTLAEFGRLCYKNTVVVNFDEHPELDSIFAASKDPKRIIEQLVFATGQRIAPEDTLLVFDEIQESPSAIGSLKYFNEQANEYHLACAGSLLGLSLAHPPSYPVGKVNLMRMYPMSFTEFLRGTGSDNLADYIGSIASIEQVPQAFFEPLLDKLKVYFVVGGMPEAVLTWSQEQGIAAVQTVLFEITEMYRRDFQKHAERALFPKIEQVWDSLPSQLARENKKFLYSLVRDGARAREYEDAVQWLSSAEIVRKVYRSSALGIPVSAYDEPSAFKIYALDVGILRRLARLAPSALIEGDRLFTEFKGALSENFVLQALLPQLDAMPRYWSQDKPRYEVDFLLQSENDIIPVEVKAGQAVHSKGLTHYRNTHAEKGGLALRFSLKNLTLDDGLLNIPLFLADEAMRLVELARSTR